MKKAFISDIINNAIISKKDGSEENMFDAWKNSGLNLLIRADTGADKTYFITNSLAKDEKVFYICNRSVLKNQIKKDTSDKNIIVKTYQEIASSIKENNEDYNSEDILKLTDDIKQSKYLVLDEVHYFTSDYSFNEYVHLSFFYLFNHLNKKQKILLSATPEVFLKLHREGDSKYDLRIYEWNLDKKLKRNYDNYNFYECQSSQAIAEVLIEKIINNEKSLVFVTSKEQYINIRKYIFNSIDSEFVNKDIIDIIKKKGVSLDEINKKIENESNRFKLKEIEKEKEKSIFKFIDSLSIFIDRKQIDKYFAIKKEIRDLYSEVKDLNYKYKSNNLDFFEWQELIKKEKSLDRFEKKHTENKNTINTYNEIIENSRFDQEILFSTKILDNGINVRQSNKPNDIPIKNIFILENDIITLRQEIGRIRIDETENVNIYILKKTAFNYENIIEKFQEIEETYKSYDNNTVERHTKKLHEPYFYVDDKYTILPNEYVKNVCKAELEYLKEHHGYIESKGSLAKHISNYFYDRDLIDSIGKTTKIELNKENTKNILKDIIFSEKEKADIINQLEKWAKDYEEKGTTVYAKGKKCTFQGTFKKMLKLNTLTCKYSNDNINFILENNNIKYNIKKDPNASYRREIVTRI
ncbi:DEAD/DEAH box helicase [Peptostreptococcus faecalis]|uniref:DEAD/DEAH box helicase n=1 Tax=Peptostreptococcus faecalis TaxID=2045015 RepID=UPI000C79B702|nr:DEAD/DEAH box helicase [Peptostreptococcus faecalis]